LDPSKRKLKQDGGNCTTRSLIISTLHATLVGWLNEADVYRTYSANWRTGHEHRTSSKNLIGRDHSGHIGIDERIILKRIFYEQNMEMWAVSKWLIIVCRGRLL
jgi:hypothetical protein